MNIRILVLSDLHARSKDRKPDSSEVDQVSYLPAYPEKADHRPFDNLEELIKRDEITADLIMCPGDICDKGDTQGFSYAWGKLNDLKRLVKARALIATCGNHDLDSRYATAGAGDDPDPKGNLLSSNPIFPFGDTPETDHYWARNFAILNPTDNVRVIALNTSAYHGGKSGELEHGRVSSKTIEAIKTKIASEPQAEINILLCHHHLQPLNSWNRTSDDLQHVRKGIDLLGEISTQTGSGWIVIHGHRHIPSISVSTTPQITTIGAASFSRMGDSFSNQFHIISIDSDPVSMTMPLRGTIDTWNWSRTQGWGIYLDPTKGLPPQCGFGFHGSIQAIAAKIDSELGDKPFLPWRDLCESIPELNHLTPSQWSTLRTKLKSNRLELADHGGIPQQVGREKNGS